MSIATLLLNTTDSLPWDTKEGIRYGRALEKTSLKMYKIIKHSSVPAEKWQACNTAYFQVVTSTNVKSIECLWN